MCDLQGTELLPDEREQLMHPRIGGVILFSRNYESPEQIATLTKTIHALRQPHLIIAVDHEGGRVQRFQEGFSRLPACAKLACYGKTQDSIALTHQVGWLMAAELLAVGIDLSFAPVLDVGNPISQVIGDRAFHHAPDEIADYGKAYVAGMKEAGMMATGKHFPGHGSVKEDSHIAIPYDHRPYNDIATHDLIPFIKLIQAGIAGVMPAHVIYSTVDQTPANFSTVWLKTILRAQLQFQGAIFSDDLSMAGAEIIGTYPERARAALAAGCDMILVCNNSPGLVTILDEAILCNNDESQSRLIRMQGQFKLTLAELKQTTLWKMRSDNIKTLNTEES